MNTGGWLVGREVAGPGPGEGETQTCRPGGTIYWHQVGGSGPATPALGTYNWIRLWLTSQRARWLHRVACLGQAVFSPSR